MKFHTLTTRRTDDRSRARAPRISGLSTAVPAHRLDQENVIERAAILFGEAVDFARLRPIYRNAAVGTRYSCVPIDWYLATPDFAERNRLYLENAVNLLEEVALGCLAKTGLGPNDIDGIVTVSTTGIATPSLDALLIERLRLRPDVARLPIFGLGCAGGVVGLARAADLAESRPGGTVLFLVVELCGLTFRSDDRSKSNLVATALFGDGAAGAVIGADRDGPAIVAVGEYTWPDTLDVMGWRLQNDGLEVIFSNGIPGHVRDKMRAATDGFLARHGLTLADIDEFICHPGGAKVLDALEAAFDLAPGRLDASRAVLRDYGNMSAATVLFVLQAALARKRRGRRLLSALGPGFTAGFVLIEPC